MVLKQDKYFAEAIFFFEDNAVVKEMLLVEFEAVLDSVVGIPEYANQEYSAAYVTVGPYLTLQSTVLFRIRFDKDGHVVKEWNLPLHALTRNAVKGPDLGQGNILLMSQPHCQDEHKESLWAPGKNEIAVLTSIRDSVKRNKLGLYDGGDRRGQGAPGAYYGIPDFDMRGRDELYIKDYQKDLVNNIEATLKYKYEDKIKELHRKHDEVVRQLEAQLEAVGKSSSEYKQQIKAMESQNKEHVDRIAGKYQAKLDKQIAQVQDKLGEQISEKELELSYSQENERQLQDEIQQLTEAIAEGKKQAVDGFLSDLLDSGVELIVTQSGVGSYSLKSGQIPGYLKSPTQFWAKQCGVPEAQYLAWYQHYRDPVCQAGKSTGCGCDVKLKRVDDPHDFVTGYSEMCDEHQLKQSKDAVQNY